MAFYDGCKSQVEGQGGIETRRDGGCRTAFLCLEGISEIKYEDYVNDFGPEIGTKIIFFLKNL